MGVSRSQPAGEEGRDQVNRVLRTSGGALGGYVAQQQVLEQSRSCMRVAVRVSVKLHGQCRCAKADALRVPHFLACQKGREERECRAYPMISQAPFRSCNPAPAWTNREGRMESSRPTRQEDKRRKRRQVQRVSEHEPLAQRAIKQHRVEHPVQRYIHAHFLRSLLSAGASLSGLGDGIGAFESRSTPSWTVSVGQRIGAFSKIPRS